MSTLFSSELMEDMKIFSCLLLEIVSDKCLFLCKLMFFLLFKLRVLILGEVGLLILLKFSIYTVQCLTYQLKQLLFSPLNVLWGALGDCDCCSKMCIFRLGCNTEML